MIRKIYCWLDERIPISSIATFLNKPVPKKLGWGYCLGSIALFLIIIQIATGVVLTMYYAPTPDHAHDSVQYIQTQLMFGKYIRGLHVWGASFIVVMVLAHMLHIFFTGGYKKPKELTWILGVLLGLVIFGFAFTGYLLPWDQKAYWATMVGTKIAGTIPIIGPSQLKFIRAGEDLGALTLTRFFSIHVILLPAAFLLLVSLHLYLVRKLGVTSYKKPEPVPESEKVPFFPNQALHDMAATFVIVLLLAAVAWYVPASLEKVADPTDKSYIPKPEWYFLFLYQLLKYFEGSYELIGTTVIPMGMVLLLFLLPFIDRRQERSPRKRPFAVGLASLIVVGVAALTLQGKLSKPPQATAPIRQASMTGAPLTPVEMSGKTLYVKLHCDQCHSINKVGGNTGPDLTEVGNRRDAQWMISHFKNPQAIAPGFKMPAVELSNEELSALSAYLLRLNGSNSEPSPALETIKQSGQQVVAATVSENTSQSKKKIVVADTKTVNTASSENQKTNLPETKPLSRKELVAMGERVFNTHKCINCHAINDIGGDEGPDLTAEGGKRTDDWHEKHFRDPKSVSPKSKMPKVKANDEELKALTAYIQSLQ